MGLGSMLRGILSRPATPAAAGPSPAASGAAAGGLAASRPAGAWRALPAIQRTVGAAPLVAPTSVFKAGLAAARPAPTALAELGHDRGLEAPAGLVSGLAAPVQRAAEGVPASVRSRARSPRAADATEMTTVARLADTGGAEPAAFPAFGTDAAAWDAADALSLRAPEPIRQAPVVARRLESPSLVVSTLGGSVPGGRVGAPPHARVDAPAAAHRDAAVGMASGGPSAGTMGSTAAPAPAPAAAADPAGTIAPAFPGGPGAALGGALAVPGLPAGPLVARAADAAGPHGLDPARPNLGQSRRLRIGAAITPGGAAPLAPSSAAGTLDAKAASAGLAVAGPGVQRSIGGSAPAAAAGSALEGGPSTPPLETIASDPGGPRSWTGLGAGLASPAPLADAQRDAAGDGPTADAVALRALTPSRAPFAPLVGTLQPMAAAASPAVAVRVQAEAEEDIVDDPGSPAAALASLARMDHRAGIHSPGGLAAFGGANELGAARPSLFSGGVPARPFAAPGAGGPTSPPSLAPVIARSTGTPTLRAVPAAAGSTGPGAARPVVRLAVGSPIAGPAPRAAGNARTMTWDPIHGMTLGGATDGPTSADWTASAPSSAPASPGAGSSAFSLASPAGLPSIAPLVARSFDDDASGAAVQREAAAAAAPTADPATGSTASTAGSTATTMPEAQLDDLARRLHERIAARISRDLLVERERSGSLIDRAW